MSDFIDHLLAQARPDAETALAPRAQSRFEPTPAADEAGFAPVAAPELPFATPIGPPVAERSPPRQAKPPRVERLEVQEFEAAAPRPVPAEARIPPIGAEEVRPGRASTPVRPEPDSPAPDDAEEPRTILQPAAELRPYEVQVQLPGEIAAGDPGEILRETIVRETLREIVPAEPAPDNPRIAAGETLTPAADPPPLAAAVPAQPQLMRSIPPPASPASPAAIVEVRIGRIEIHAGERASPAVEAAPAPVTAGPSRLDRYLARG
jgi:hypothetical protein